MDHSNQGLYQKIAVRIAQMTKGLNCLQEAIEKCGARLEKRDARLEKTEKRIEHLAQKESVKSTDSSVLGLKDDVLAVVGMVEKLSLRWAQTRTDQAKLQDDLSTLKHDVDTNIKDLHCAAKQSTSHVLAETSTAMKLLMAELLKIVDSRFQGLEQTVQSHSCQLRHPAEQVVTVTLNC